MAIIKYSGLVSDIRGHVGSVVFSQWKGIGTARTRQTHSNYAWGSPFTALHRAETDMLAKAWRDMLNDYQRAQWNVFAIAVAALDHSYVKLTGWKNYGGNMSGWNAFCLTNSLRFSIGESAIMEDPPDVADRPSQPTFSSLTQKAGSPPTLIATYTYPVTPTITTFARVWVRGTRYAHLLLAALQEIPGTPAGAWDNTYECDDTPPLATPAWTLSGTDNSSVASGILTVDTGGVPANASYYYRQNTTQGTILSFETKIKVQDTDDPTYWVIRLRSGTNTQTQTTTEISRHAITYTDAGGSQQSYAADFHTAPVVVRIQLTASDLKIWLDGALVIDEASYSETGTSTTIFFGRAGGSDTWLEMDYLYWGLQDFPPDPVGPPEISNLHFAQGAVANLPPDIYKVQIDVVDESGLWSPPSDIKALQIT